MKAQKIFILPLVLFVISIELCHAQNTNVPWHALTMGYQGWEGGNTTLRSVVGQGFVGIAQQPNTRVTSGFLAFTLSKGVVEAVTDHEELPSVYSLAQNYPNPFNPSTTIHFEVPSTSRVTLRVYNVLGQEVLTVLDEEKAPGRYDVRVDASALSSGAYFYRLQAHGITPAGGRDFVQTRKLLLVR